MLQSQAEKPDLGHTHTVFNQEREIHHSVTYQTVFSFLFKNYYSVIYVFTQQILTESHSTMY